jgi:hypothetical protein
MPELVLPSRHIRLLWRDLCQGGLFLVAQALYPSLVGTL